MASLLEEKSLEQHEPLSMHLPPISLAGNLQHEPQFVFYIFVNTDIGLNKGALCAQASHITQVIVDEIIRQTYESIKVPQYCIDYVKWKSNPKTIVLKASSEELLKLSKMTNAKIFIDAVQGIDQLTTVSFYPDNNKLGGLTDGFKLL